MDIFIYLSILVSLVFLSMDKLNLSLSGDELAFAQTGVNHGINLSKIVSELSPFFDEIAFKNLVQFFSFFSLLAFGLLFFLCLKVNTHNHQLIITYESCGSYILKNITPKPQNPSTLKRLVKIVYNRELCLN